MPHSVERPLFVLGFCPKSRVCHRRRIGKSRWHLGRGELLSGAYVPPMRRAGTSFRLLGFLFGFLAILSPGRHNGVGCVLPCGDSPAPLEPVMSILAFLCCCTTEYPCSFFNADFPTRGRALPCSARKAQLVKGSGCRATTTTEHQVQKSHQGSKEPPRPEKAEKDEGPAKGRSSRHFAYWVGAELPETRWKESKKTHESSN